VQHPQQVANHGVFGQFGRNIARNMRATGMQHFWLMGDGFG
jgi:hypothetical protein